MSADPDLRDALATYVEIPPGWHIRRAVEKAIEIARLTQRDISFRFNNTLLEVDENSDLQAVVKEWMLKHNK